MGVLIVSNGVVQFAFFGRVAFAALPMSHGSSTLADHQESSFYVGVQRRRTDLGHVPCEWRVASTFTRSVRGRPYRADPEEDSSMIYVDSVTGVGMVAATDNRAHFDVNRGLMGSADNT